MSQEFLTLDLKAVEEFLYPIACSIFDQPGYVMPELRWLDRNRMEAALQAVNNGYFSDILEAAAALAYYVNKAHALFDGNKRMTVVVLYSFLLLNGYVQKELMSYEDVVALTEELAASESAEMASVIQAIRQKLEETVRPLTDAERAEIFGLYT